MPMFEFIPIGQLLKPYRQNGEFLALIDPVFFQDLENSQAVFLQVDGLEVPFFLESMELDPATSYLKVEEFNAPEDIKAFNGSTLFLRTVDIEFANQKLKEKNDKIGLAGFTLLDQTSGIKCPILSVEEYPQQWMALVKYQDRDILIPLAEDYIRTLDEDDKELIMELPEGIFDI